MMEQDKTTYYGIDVYMEWVQKEGLPITEDYGVNLHEVPTADWARCETTKAEVLVADETGMVQAQILGALEHCFPLIGSCVTEAAPEADIGSHPVRLAVPEAFQHVCFSLIIQSSGGARFNTKAAAGAGIFSWCWVRCKLQFREYCCEDHPRPEFGMHHQVMEAKATEAC